MGEDLLGANSNEYVPYDYRTRGQIELNKWYYIGCVFGSGKNSIMGVMIYRIYYLNKYIDFSINFVEGAPTWFVVLNKTGITENYKIGIKFSYTGKGYGAYQFYIMQTSGTPGNNDFKIELLNKDYYLSGNNGNDYLTTVITTESVDNEIEVTA